MAAHSDIVGGSSASRVMHCPGSVALVAKAPPKPSSSYADEGTLCHNAIDIILDKGKDPQEMIGMTYNDIVMTQELLDDKVKVALDIFADEVDPDFEMEFMTETVVSFGDFLPGVFGSADVLGRLGKRAIVLDWKFGSGVIVEAEESYQGMFYAAAAMRTPECQWIFDGVDEVEIIIVQPPEIRRWVTTIDRIKRFENELVAALLEAKKPDAKLHAGDWCKWCAAKPTCPQMTGAVERALKKDLSTIKPEVITLYLGNWELLKEWGKSLEALAFQMLENGVAIPAVTNQDGIVVPGKKLVPTQARRSWVDEAKAKAYLLSKLPKDEVVSEDILSPAQAEKALKKAKLLWTPEEEQELIVKLSSGNKMVDDTDPTPAVNPMGKQMIAALNKLK